MKPDEAMKIVGDWISDETHKRRYKKEELKLLSEALIMLKRIINNQVTDEEKDYWTYSQCGMCGQFVEDGQGFDYCPYCGEMLEVTEDEEEDE